MILLLFSFDVLLYYVFFKSLLLENSKKGCPFAMFCLMDSGLSRKDPIL